MSDNILKIIPQDPEVAPSRHLLGEVSKLLSIYLQKDIEDIKVIITNEIRFVDCGANFKELRCPSCGQIIDPGWWQEAMQRAYEQHFRVLAVQSPCCKQGMSLNDLVYDWPAGFARVSLEVLNPNGDLNVEEQESLNALLGTRTRKIWAHV